MESKKPFKQVTIKEAQERKKAKELLDKYTDKYLAEIDFATDKAVVDVLRELGYTEAVEGMSVEEAERIHSDMNSKGMFLNISKEVTLEGGLVIRVSLVQTARELNFTFDTDNLEEKS